MKARIKRPAVVTLSVLALLSLTSCTDPSAIGAIPSDAPIDTIAEPTPTETPADWFSDPSTEKPDWEGMSLGGLKINGDEYSYLELEGESPRFRNITTIPFNVGDTEPRIDPTRPFVIEFQSRCQTAWVDASKRSDKDGKATLPTFSMFIAKSENAVDGVPVTCTTDNMNYDGKANSWAWFIDPGFTDGRYFIITTVEGSAWRQVAPLTISTGILNKQGLGLLENGIRHDPRATALPGEQGEISWLPVVKRTSQEANATQRWWVDPRQDKFLSASEINVTGSGTNSDPITVSFVVRLVGDYRTARTNTWILGRGKNATSGPEISCSSKENEAGYPVQFDCSTRPFVDDKGKAVVYYLTVISQPGSVRQVIKLPVK